MMEIAVVVSLARFVSRLRELEGWSRAAVAKRATQKGFSISESYVQKIEEGMDPAHISTGKLDALASGLRVERATIDAVIAGKVDEYANMSGFVISRGVILADDQGIGDDSPDDMERALVYREIIELRIAKLQILQQTGELTPRDESDLLKLLNALKREGRTAKEQADIILHTVRDIYAEQFGLVAPKLEPKVPKHPTVEALEKVVDITTAREIKRPPTMMVFPLADYFQTWLLEHAMEPDQADRSAGAPKGSIASILDGLIPEPKDLRKWANKLGMNAVEVLEIAKKLPYREMTEEDITPIEEVRMRRLPQFGEAACGDGALVPEHAERWNAWPEWMVEGADGTMVVRGDSMQGAGYSAGDTLFIRTLRQGEKPRPDTEVIASVEAGVVCKFYRRDPDLGEYLEGAPASGRSEIIPIRKARVVAVVVGHYKRK